MLIHLIAPEIAGEFDSWVHRYEKTFSITKKKGNRYITIPLSTTYRNLDELSQRISPVTFRVKRDQNIDVEDRIEIVVTDMTEKQRRLYSEALEEARLWVSSQKSLNIQAALQRTLRCLQIGEGLFNLDYSLSDSGKLEFLEEELSQAEDKIAVWARFKPITNKLYERFKTKAVLLTGDVSDSLRELGKWAFQGCKNDFETEQFYKLRERYPDFKFEPGEAQFSLGTMDVRSSLGVDLSKATRQFVTSFHYNGNVMMQALARIITIEGAHDTLTTFLVANEKEKKALRLIIRNYQTTLEILDGKKDRTHSKMQDLLRILLET